MALEGDDLETAVGMADADFIVLPASGLAIACSIRSATSRPLLLRLPSGGTDEEIDRAADQAMEAGWNGCVTAAGMATPLLKDGEMDCPAVFERSLKTVGRLARRDVPVMGAGGIFTPGQATALLDEGAKLVELHAGLVYAGPGLPSRIIHALEHQKKEGPTPEPSIPPPLPPTGRPSIGILLTAVTGVALSASGILALILAATVQLLPNDVSFLQMTVSELYEHHEGRIVHFMAHDRVAFGGSILSIGILYLWLAFGPPRQCPSRL